MEVGELDAWPAADVLDVNHGGESIIAASVRSIGG
jgi:hypothetical protein